MNCPICGKEDGVMDVGFTGTRLCIGCLNMFTTNSLKLAQESIAAAEKRGYERRAMQSDLMVIAERERAKAEKLVAVIEMWLPALLCQGAKLGGATVCSLSQEGCGKRDNGRCESKNILAAIAEWKKEL
jgi:hypothetical protein